MALPLCSIAAESVDLSVGHGVAVVTIEAAVRGRPGGCVVDAGAALRAREEGRAAPELVAFRVSIDGRPSGMGGPLSRVTVDVPHAATVRFVAVLRGDRFAAVPLSADPAVVTAPVPFRTKSRSVWGPARIAGVARWTETGAPVVITVDPTRDHEPSEARVRVERGQPVEVLIADAGPRLAGEPVLGTEEARVAALARGDVEALSVLLGDLPLSIATASDSSAALSRLRETARAARAAVLSSDPLFVAVGERLTTAVMRGFTSCARPTGTQLPPRWPAAPRELVASGLYEDAESGCPRVSDLLAVNHPDVRFGQEGGSILTEVAALSTQALPRVGPLDRGPHDRNAAPRRARPILLAALSALLGLVLAAVALSRSSASR